MSEIEVMIEINEEWMLDPNGTHEDHWVDLICDSYEDSSHWTHAAVKWDGCIHLNTASNVPFSKESGNTHSGNRDTSACDDYIHICNLRKYIEKLQKLEKFAKEYFKNKEWSYE